MNITKILNKTTTFLVDPHNEDHSALVKGLAWVTTIFVGIVTLGTAQGLSALWRWQSHIEKNDTQDLIAEKFQEIFGKEKDDSALKTINWRVENPLFDPTYNKTAKQLPPKSVKFELPLFNPPKGKTAQQLSPKNPSIQTASVSEISSESDESSDFSFEKIAYGIYYSRKEYFLDKDEKTIIEEICQMFKNEGYSLSDIEKHPTIIKTFLEDDILGLALVLYAQEQGLRKVLSMHLIFLSEQLSLQIDDLYKKAEELANKEPNLPPLYALLRLAEESFSMENRSLSEVFTHQESLDILMKNEKLKMVCALYAGLRERVARNKKDPTIGLGMKMEDFSIDEVHLDKKLRNFLLKNHPIKNFEDPEAMSVTTILRAIIRGDMNAYHTAYQNLKTEEAE